MPASCPYELRRGAPDLGRVKPASRPPVVLAVASTCSRRGHPLGSRPDRSLRGSTRRGGVAPRVRQPRAPKARQLAPENLRSLIGTLRPRVASVTRSPERAWPAAGPSLSHAPPALTLYGRRLHERPLASPVGRLYPGHRRGPTPALNHRPRLGAWSDGLTAPACLLRQATNRDDGDWFGDVPGEVLQVIGVARVNVVAAPAR